MKNFPDFPQFDARYPVLNDFIHHLVDRYEAGTLNSWASLEALVSGFFTADRMVQMETVLPGWGKMSSYSNGQTLTHVMCVFLSVYRMPEFQDLDSSQKGLMKWVILFHDLEKQIINGKRDFTHAFRSAVTAARLLPGQGFTKTPEYHSVFGRWSEWTLSARTKIGDPPEEVQDNSKIPGILDGIERMFGVNTPAALIVKTVLFHLSVDMKEWPPPAPLTSEEMQRYFDVDLLPLLKIMHLGDSDAWSRFEPESRERMHRDTNDAFEYLDRLISKTTSRRSDG